MSKAGKKKIWRLPEYSEPSAELLEAADGSDILAQLMLRKGINTAEAAGAFLDPANYKPTSPNVFADMPKALERINKAIASQEKITVYGDYDVDGVTATSVMLTALKRLGANVDFYIPNRATEGYGLNLKAVSILASKQRCKLIITCDCGISNFAEINLAKSLGVETIIVDHHSMPELLPPAVAILHPKYFEEDHPLFHLPGVGVAYKLAEALFLEKNMPEEIAKLHDFVTLGMIADMVPLVRENRYLVQIGLPALVKSERAGIRALLDNTVKMEGTDIVGFGLAPRINAVGRLADASLAVNLMTVEDEHTAQQLAHQLESENTRRQELCEQIFFEADQKAKQVFAANPNDSALALYSETWHHGVVGIVASRLVEKYHCPVFVAELDAEEGKIKGSARGVSGIDLYQILKENEQLMTKWGGHQMAAGFSAEAGNADLLCRALVDSCNRALTGHNMRPIQEIDLVLEADNVDLSLAKLLQKLGPFGMWNKKPVLAMEAMTVLSAKPLGKEGKHHRLMLRSSDGAHQFECVFWRSANNVPEDGTTVDLAFNPDVNFFNKSERLQLVLCDWRKTGEIEEEEEVLDFTPPVVAEAPPVVAEAPAVVATTRAVPQSLPQSDPASIDMSPPPAQKMSQEREKITAQSMRSLESAIDDNVAEDDIEVYPDGAMSGGVEEAEAEPTPKVRGAGPRTTGDLQSLATQQINWKDLRHHASVGSVADAAIRKLGDQVQVFAEASKLEGHVLLDRSSLESRPHLLIWQYPPSLQSFRAILAKSGASSIYLCGAAVTEDYSASSFLKRLMSMVRFAVNQKDGQAHAEKLCAALATTKMALALGLTVLKKLNIVDWYAEESIIYMDIVGNPSEGWGDLLEYRQLANTLKEITEFRSWCAEAPLDEIQSELVPNAIRLNVETAGASQEGPPQYDTYPRANYNDRSNPSSQQRKS